MMSTIKFTQGIFSREIKDMECGDGVDEQFDGKVIYGPVSWGIGFICGWSFA